VPEPCRLLSPSAAVPGASAQGALGTAGPDSPMMGADESGALGSRPAPPSARLGDPGGLGMLGNVPEGAR
jgi:hypothetical protein